VADTILAKTGSFLVVYLKFFGTSHMLLSLYPGVVKYTNFLIFGRLFGPLLTKNVNKGNSY
jgi:hypothetical protein